MENEFKPVYDSKPLFIESISPSSGSPEGTNPVTLNGYFSNFDPTRDSVEFSGIKVPEKDITDSAPDKITFKAPPKSSLGSAPDYEVTVKVGNGISNRVKYSYVVPTDELTFDIAPTGTSELENDRLKVSACTPVKFTVTSTPATDQIKSFGWALSPEGDANTDLFKTKDSLKSIDTSKGTIDVNPEQIGAAGTYILTVTITLDTGVVKKSVVLVKDNTPAPGVSIPQLPKRTMSRPDAPVIINAVVTMPGACYTGDSSVRYQWEVFGKTYDFTPTEATGDGRAPPEGIRPGRLGRELIIPRDALSPGVHKVDFRVWLGNATEPSATDSTTFEVTPERLVPVIRNGEKLIETNWVTDLEVFGTNSYDPDVLGPKKNDGITYKWKCTTSATIDQAGKVACSDSILPKDSVTSPSFTVPKEEIRKLGDNVKYIQYTLEVTKPPAPGTTEIKTASTTLDVKVVQGGTKPVLVDYSLTLVTIDETAQDPLAVPTYQTTILKLSGVPEGVTWTYELIEPKIQDFQFNDLLQDNPAFYSPAEKPTGSRKPLGFAPNKLSPLTTYTVLIKFLASNTTEETSVTYSFTTLETPRLGEIKPLPAGGDTSTVFTVDAGLTLSEDRFAFYFYITDSEGNEFCVGGCTGKHITYFRIPTPGTYTLSARLFDKRGFFELDKKVLPTPVVIKKSGNEKNTIKSLSRSFKTGDDAAWFGAANDISIVASDETPSKSALEILFGRTYEDLSNAGILRGKPSSPSNGGGSTNGGSPEPSPEESSGPLSGEPSSQPETYAQQRAKARSLIASGIRKIICSSTPNSQSGRNALLLVLRILRAPYVSADTWYDLLFITKCVIENAGPNDYIDGDKEIPEILGLLYKHAESLDSRGLSRSRLRNSAGSTGSLAADAAIIVGRLMVRAYGVGKLDGFKMTKQLGPNGKFGFVSMFVGSSASQMDSASVNGRSRQVLQGKTPNELFYINSQRYETVFSGGAKRYIVLHTTPNFVVNSGLQDEPIGGNLGNFIYWPQIYGRSNSNSAIERLRPTSKEPAYCMRLPVEKKRDFFTKSMVRMPGMYSCRNVKPLGVDASRKGEFFQYDRSGMKVIEFKVTPESGWVEACHTAPKLFGATSIDSGSDNAAKSIGLQKAIIGGDNGILIPFLVGGGILVFCVILIIAWTVAFKSGMASAGMGPYVERDASGRAASAATPAAAAT